ncbi:hypothetical protein MMMDOFMJ_0203 [Methylobacterium gnaphalii]|uniref:Uncharacterized protein n=2 Tax=Methylobacterium gnaphalii TaxID=1010610 RepID=A0A512JIM0_9HYPH|nr:hypothetical protein [Methylobacterium gnaphalii]GEP09796.1 hypothetical protein MGN01_16410 [Methylobacterium gnaphalii]GJD67289.1 hypothetical protein MMMDOFMJ_0203 [Methylobacterium gnaphalii]GLS49826.1 hypothetical protein GCM10007885_26780 [Methylobacterium gnaphalii]
MVGRHPVNDVDYAIQTTDAYVGIVGLTHPIAMTLPDASLYTVGQPLYIADETGQCSTTLPITVKPMIGQTIVGSTTIDMVVPGQKLIFHANGTSRWTVS